MKATYDQHRIDQSHVPITGLPGDDQPKVYPAIGDVVQEIIEHFQRNRREPPSSREPSMPEVVVPIVPADTFLLTGALAET